MKPKYVLCPRCKKKIHIDDAGMIDKRGVWHSLCAELDFIENSEYNENTESITKTNNGKNSNNKQ